MHSPRVTPIGEEASGGHAVISHSYTRGADNNARTAKASAVANKPRPKSANYSYTEEFRTYFELNGNVYTGSLIKDGTVLGGSYYLSNINGTTVATRYTFLPFDIRMNKAAYDSLVAAMKI
jgi:hypothetical protein